MLQSNLLIKDNGRGALCDFGSAHELDEMFQDIASKTTQRCTVRWASPERLDSNDPPTPSSDIWSWGWLTWEVRLPNELTDRLFRSGLIPVLLDHDGKGPLPSSHQCFRRDFSHNYIEGS